MQFLPLFFPGDIFSKISYIYFFFLFFICSRCFNFHLEVLSTCIKIFAKVKGNHLQWSARFSKIGTMGLLYVLSCRFNEILQKKDSI